MKIHGFDSYDQDVWQQLSPTLKTANGADGMMNVVVERERESYGINPQGGGMLPFDRECGETLAIGHGGGVMQKMGVDVYNHAVSGDVAVTLNANSGKPGSAGPNVLELDDRALAEMRYIVRRLTPMECERLQGLPDRWTIPAFRPGEITDALVAEFVEIHNTFSRIMAEYANAKPPKPKTANQVRKWLEKIANPATCPDAPRYKACGNGWATNQPRWILLRLLAEDNRESRT